MLKFIHSGPFAALFECGFRPFFLLTAITAVVAIAIWAGFFTLGMPLPPAANGPIIWHAHEMLAGFAIASVVGFVVTAIPEFTSTSIVGRHPILILLILWIIGRAAFAVSVIPGGTIIAMLADLGLLGVLIAIITPRLWRNTDRRHVSFLWILLVMAAVTGGFYFDVLTGAYPMRWLLVMVGLLMALIVIALSRISMRIVNAALNKTGETGAAYLARPPRRNLAIFCILLYTLAEFVALQHPVSGWLALAAAAALFNLTNDWHIGRALLQHWAFMLYLVYWFMALGYALIGVAILMETTWISAGRHLLLIGALGLAVFAVMNIAGRVHAGFEPDKRRWVPVAVILIVSAAVLRAMMHAGPISSSLAIAAASICWIGAFSLHLIFHWQVLTGPRTDGQHGCAGLANNSADSPAQGQTLPQINR